MNTRTLAPRLLIVVGSIAIALGALDPLEGAFIVVPGGAMVALGAYLAQSRKRKLLYVGFIVLAVYLLAIMTTSALGGWGANARVLRSDWWGLCMLLFPLGWLICAVGITFTLTELFQGTWRLAVTTIWGLAAMAALVWQCILTRILLHL